MYKYVSLCTFCCGCKSAQQIDWLFHFQLNCGMWSAGVSPPAQDSVGTEEEQGRRRAGALRVLEAHPTLYMAVGVRTEGQAACLG